MSSTVAVFKTLVQPSTTFSKEYQILVAKSYLFYRPLARYSICFGERNERRTLFLFGNKLLVCEAKSTSHVATLREFEYALENIRYGINQISKRISLLNSRMRDLKAALGIGSDSELSVAGLLISNEGFFDGFSANETFCISLRSLIGALEGITEESQVAFCVEHASRAERIYQQIMRVVCRLSEENKSDDLVVIREGFMKTKDGSFAATFDYAEFEYFAEEE